jgi:hypothetical protein
MEIGVESCESQKQNLAAEILQAAGKVTLAARGHSMLPALWPGDLLHIEPISFDRVRPGDIVLYRRWERFFIHRVLCKSDKTGSDRPSLVTRGDSMTGFDALVSPEELLGRVVSVQRTSGQFSPAPRCSKARRVLGLMLGASNRLRSVVLRWHNWRTRPMKDSGASTSPAPSGQSLG